MEHLFTDPVPLWCVVLTTLGSGLTVIIFCIMSFLPLKPWHRILTLPASLMASALTIALIVWLHQARSERELDYTQDCEVKLVNFPSGETIQMFCDASGTNHNANKMFHRIIPEDSVVRRFVYKRVYHNIYFAAQRNFLDDQYRVVKKDTKSDKNP